MKVDFFKQPSNCVVKGSFRGHFHFQLISTNFKLHNYLYFPDKLIKRESGLIRGLYFKASDSAQCTHIFLNALPGNPKDFIMNYYIRDLAPFI